MASALTRGWAWFHYESDAGWGCVWRSIQNALYRIVGLNRRMLVPTVQEMIGSLDYRTQALVNRAPRGWGEPAMTAGCGVVFRVGVTVDLFSFGHNANMYQKSRRTDYSILADLRDLWDSLLSGPCALVVDDGVFAVMICSLDGETAVVVDPHYTDYARTTKLASFGDFERQFRNGAMIAKITKRPPPDASDLVLEDAA